MDAKKAKCQRDKRGHIIENAKERRLQIQGEEQNNGEVITTSNTSDALEVEEADNLL